MLREDLRDTVEMKKTELMWITKEFRTAFARGVCPRDLLDRIRVSIEITAK